MDFEAPQEHLNPLSQAVPGKFHGSGGQSKCNCFQDKANFYRSWAWQIVLIFNTTFMSKFFLYTGREFGYPISCWYRQAQWWIKIYFFYQVCLYHVYGSNDINQAARGNLAKCRQGLSKSLGTWNDNSLAPRRFWWNFRCVIFKLISMIDCCVISCEIAVRWMSFDLTDDKSTLVQVMVWCHQATSHYLSQC